MESIVRKLRMHHYKARIAVCRINLTRVEQKLENKSLTIDERVSTQCKWADAMRQSHAAQLMLEMLERQEREGRPDDG